MKINDSDIEIRSLAGISFDEIAQAFLEAFSDYDIKLDRESLFAMLKRRGARMDLSFAAFHGQRIVSFIINGIGTFAGLATAYDTGTGTVKEFRGLGLTDRILNHSFDVLESAGITTYLLEVLEHNAPAVRIYTRQGFAIEREFDCYTGEVAAITGRLSCRVSENLRIERSSVDEIERYASFMDFMPSWQNSLDSVRRNPDAFLCLTANVGDAVVGWGVSETAYGDITLLAVDGAYRRQGVGSRLLLELVSASVPDRVKVLNVDDRCECMKSFVESSGLELSCRQYEMMKHLGSMFCG